MEGTCADHRLCTGPASTALRSLREPAAPGTLGPAREAYLVVSVRLPRLGRQSKHTHGHTGMARVGLQARRLPCSGRVHGTLLLCLLHGCLVL